MASELPNYRFSHYGAQKMTFIIGKSRASDGKVVIDSSPVVHETYESAKELAEKLAAADPTAKEFLIFKAFAKTMRTSPPVLTTMV